MPSHSSPAVHPTAHAHMHAPSRPRAHSHAHVQIDDEAEAVSSGEEGAHKGHRGSGIGLKLLRPTQATVERLLQQTRLHWSRLGTGQRRLARLFLAALALYLALLAFSGTVRVYHATSSLCHGLPMARFQLPTSAPLHPYSCPAMKSPNGLMQLSSSEATPPSEPLKVERGRNRLRSLNATSLAVTDTESDGLSMRVPNYVHYVFGLADSPPPPFPLVFYLSLASAVRVQHAERIYMHHHHPPTGPWWDACVALLGPRLIMNKVDQFDHIFDRPVHHYAHKSDFVRLQQLLLHGGIYLDLDVILVRSFDPLRRFPLVLGEEAIAPGPWNQAKVTIGLGDGGWYARARGVNGLANAIIVAEKDHFFVREWHDQYRSFNYRHWSEHCCVVPLLLADRWPDALITITTTGFFLPQFEQLADFFQRDEWDFKPNWAVHMWHHLSWEPYLKQITSIEQLRRQHTSFSRLAIEIIGEGT